MPFSMRPDLLAGWHVLVVDDEPDSIEVARALLELCGATVQTANNGQAALDYIEAQRPDFILSDLSMPVLSGWDMLAILQKDRATRDIPVIALTAHAMRGDRERAIAAGFYNYLSKPLQPETFVYDTLRLLIDIPEIAALLEEDT